MKTRIFALLMAMMMVLGLFAAGASVAFADETAEAVWGTDKDNLTESGTLQEALNAAKDDSSITYIKVMNDVAATDAMDVYGGHFTLDLNGKTISSSSSTVFYLGKSVNMTITDTSVGQNGVLESTKESGYTIMASDDSDVQVTIEAGTLRATQPIRTSTASGAASNMSVTVTGGTLANTGVSSTGTVVDIAWKSGGTLDLSEYGDKLEGLSISHGCSACNVEDSNILLPDGFHFYKNGQKVDQLGERTTYTIQFEAVTDAEPEEITSEPEETSSEPEETSSEPEVEVTPEAYWGTDKDNLTQSGTLQDALDAAKEDSSITYIKVAQDVDLGEESLLADGGAFTLDLNGKTVESSALRLLMLENSVNITIADSASGGKLYCKGYNVIAMDDVSNVRITISGGTLESDVSNVIDLTNSGYATEAELTITDGTLKSNGTTARVIGASGKSVKISGGSFESNLENIYWRAGTLDITDCSTPDGLTFYFSLDYDPELSIEHVLLPDSYSLYYNGERVDDALQDGATYTVNPTKYQITVNATQNGSVSVSPEGTWFEKGALVEITVTPDEGYFIDSFLVNGEPLPGDVDSISTLVDGDITVTATFNRDEAAWGTDKDNLTEKGTLEEAFLAAIESENATYIQLLVDLGDMLLPRLTAGTIILDLNGNTISNVPLVVNGADVTVLDSKGFGQVYDESGAIYIVSGKVTLLGGKLYGDYQDLIFEGGVVDLSKYAFLEGFRVYILDDSDVALSAGNFILPVSANFRDDDGNKLDVLATEQIHTIVLDEAAWGTDADHLTSSGSFEDAMKAANKAEGALYIRINKEIYLESEIAFDGCEVIFDFAGNQIFADADISIKNGAKVTFVDETDMGGILGLGYSGIYVKKATLVIEGGNYGMSREIYYTSYEPFVLQNGADVTVNGGNVAATYETFRVYGGAKLTVNDGTFTAGYSIFITLETGSSNKSSTIVVNGGEFVNAGSDDFVHITYGAKSNFDLTAMGDEIEGWIVKICEYGLFGINGEGFLPEGYTLYDQNGMPGSHILTADIYEDGYGLFTIGKAPEESYTVTFVNAVFGGEDIVLTVYPENNDFTIYYHELFEKPNAVFNLRTENSYINDFEFFVEEDLTVYINYSFELIEEPTKENNYSVKTAYDELIASYKWYRWINDDFVPLEEETGSSMQNIVHGYYYCVMGILENGNPVYFQMDDVDLTVVINEASPTETPEKPFVELEENVDVKYQWYEFDVVYGEEFNQEGENLINAHEDNQNGLTYVDGRGWLVAPEFNGWCSYVEVYLTAGQTIALTYDRDVVITSIWCNEDGQGDQYTEWMNLTAGQTVFFTAKYDGWYEMDVNLSYNMDIPAIRIYDVTVTETPIEGETAAVMQNPVANTYYLCKISDTEGWNVLAQTSVIRFVNGFVKQPDSTTPGVEVADDTDGKYQWYTVDFGTEITDENAILPEGALISLNYVEGLGWEGAAPQMALKSTRASGVYYFAVFEAEEDESIRILTTAQRICSR